MDISIEVEKYRLNVRTSVVIIHDNKILLHKSDGEDHYALVGGRVKFGETSEEAIKREVLEELGKEIEITGYIGTIENFFKWNEVDYQEILFMHKAEFKKEVDKKNVKEIKNVEGRKDLKYVWVDLEELAQCDLRPAVAKDIILEGKFPVHKVNID